MQRTPTAEFRQLVEVQRSNVIGQHCVWQNGVHTKNGKSVTWNGCWNHSEFRVPQIASMRGAIKSTGRPQSAKNAICPHSCNIMPLVVTNFSTTLSLQIRIEFIITPQG